MTSTEVRSRIGTLEREIAAIEAAAAAQIEDKRTEIEGLLQKHYEGVASLRRATSGEVSIRETRR